MEDPAKFKTFEDLDAYKAARQFRKARYTLSRRLPDFEKFELASQFHRAAVSLTNNIAEGHGRFHYLDQIKLMLQSRGSLEELQDDLNVCEDEKYLPPSDNVKMKEEVWRVHKIFNGCIRYLRGRKANEPYVLHDGKPADDFSDGALNELQTASSH